MECKTLVARALRPVRSLRLSVVCALAVAAMVVMGADLANATPTYELPDLGLNSAIEEYVTLAITAIGAFILMALGAFFAIKSFNIGVRWISKLIGVN
jgi:hypothetical protein